MATTIKLKRSIKSNTSEDVKDTLLNYGEPAYVANTYLYIGKGTVSGDTTETRIGDQGKVFKALPTGLVDNQVFYDTSPHSSQERPLVWLKDESNQWLTPETLASQVYMTGEEEDERTIVDYIDSIKYAGSSRVGGPATSAKKLDLDSIAVGSNSKPIYFNSLGEPKVCEGPLDIGISGNANTATNATTATNSGNIAVRKNNGIKLYLTGTIDTPDPAGYRALYNNENIYISENNVLIGAAWNDFAELRQCSAEPGTCVAETGTGPLIRSTERLQPGCSIVSDTYGMLIGPQEPNYKAIAVAGRVLATPFEDRELFTAGAAVCSAPDGKISIMTREEIKEFPDRIVGYVSEIPDYDVWTNGVKVNNRIWIKVK